VDALLPFVQAAFPTALTGGGLVGIYMYFRKIDAAIREDLRKTIAAQQAEIESLWTENRKLRKEANDDGAADTDEGDGK
jgi:hypothetical protein